MIKATTITDGQSLLDVAIQELGTIAAVFDLAAANGLAITDPLTPGQVLSVPSASAALPQLAAYFRQRGQRINTGNDSASEVPTRPAGIFDDTYADPFN